MYHQKKEKLGIKTRNSVYLKPIIKLAIFIHAANNLTQNKEYFGFHAGITQLYVLISELTQLSRQII